MLLSLIAIMVFFQVMTDGTLLQPLNLTNLVLQNSYIVIMALGMLLVIVAGHIDLSVGSVAGFVGARRGGADGATIDVALSAGRSSPACWSAALIGAAQGYWVAYLEHPVLHRHAGRHAGVQGPGAGAAGRASRSGRSRRTSRSCQLGLHPRPVSATPARLHPTSLLHRRRAGGGRCVYASARRAARASRLSTACEVEPYRASSSPRTR